MQCHEAKEKIQLGHLFEAAIDFENKNLLTGYNEKHIRILEALFR